MRKGKVSKEDLKRRKLGAGEKERGNIYQLRRIIYPKGRGEIEERGGNGGQWEGWASSVRGRHRLR